MAMHRVYVNAPDRITAARVVRAHLDSIGNSYETVEAVESNTQRPDAEVAIVCTRGPRETFNVYITTDEE